MRRNDSLVYKLTSRLSKLVEPDSCACVCSKLEMAGLARLLIHFILLLSICDRMIYADGIIIIAIDTLTG